MESAACLTIAAFPPGDDLWRVEWFGQTDFPDRRQRNRQASVCVSLSRVSLLSALNSFAQPPLKCWVSVGTLVMLRIGDLYRNRRYVGPGEAESETFADIAVDPPGTGLIKAGIRGGGYTRSGVTAASSLVCRSLLDFARWKTIFLQSHFRLFTIFGMSLELLGGAQPLDVRNAQHA